jgi:Ubiquitin-2 like Rad60 SUMO-like
VYFKIKKQTPLRKLMDAYCQRQGISPNSIRFLYDGQRIQAERTPKEVCSSTTQHILVVTHTFPLQLDMEDSDIIGMLRNLSITFL